MHPDKGGNHKVSKLAKIAVGCGCAIAVLLACEFCLEFWQLKTVHFGVSATGFRSLGIQEFGFRFFI